MVAQIEEELSEAGYDPVEGVTLERAREIDSRIVHWDRMNEAGREIDLEPDSPGDSAYAGTDVEPIAWEDEAPEPEAELPEEPPRPRIFRREPVEDRGSQEEADTASDEDEMVPEAALADLAGRIEAELHDHIPEEIEAEIAPEEDLADFTTDDSVELDEEMLREMVADIVRQELQGALGERITRNVRKLVRREIHRALAARELE